MSSVRVFQVDAFTSRRFTGNPAGVVLDADGLSMQDMRALARELNNPDTGFVLRPDGEDHDLRVRFLTPRGEAAFIGHVTLAVHGVLASLNRAPQPRQKQANGIVQVDVIAGASPPRIAIHLPVPQLLGPIDPRALSALLEALSLSSSDLDARCPPMIAGKSSTRLMLALADAGTLARVTPDLPRLAQLSTQLAAPGVFLFTLRPAMADVYTEARMFCPALGIPEDPVSGNAHAMLGVYLLQHGLITADEEPSAAAATIEFTGAQGHHMERPGRVTVALNMVGRTLESVSIVGEVMVVFESALEF